MATIMKIAFEGVNGVGKSHVITNLKDALEDKGDQVLTAKIGGLAEGSEARAEFQRLNRKRREGLLTQQESGRLKRDLVFRDEYKHRISEFLKMGIRDYSYVLFDRMPLMSWVYTEASDPGNPFLSEIREDALIHTRLVMPDIAFVIEIKPESVYARLLARSLKHNPELSVGELLDYVKAPERVACTIQDLARILSKDPNILPKPVSMGDYVPYDKLQRQMDTYRSVVETASRELGFKWHVLFNEGGTSDTIQVAMECIENLKKERVELAVN